mmetsp:Transcript_53464/g.81096  ORF Transcript_53464/g.81096 Transcript_53464/m.81096 type:complete len:291 (+) Transcript_53464:356-1228(+)
MVRVLTRASQSPNKTPSFSHQPTALSCEFQPTRPPSPRSGARSPHTHASSISLLRPITCCSQTPQASSPLRKLPPPITALLPSFLLLFTPPPRSRILLLLLLLQLRRRQHDSSSSSLRRNSQSEVRGRRAGSAPLGQPMTSCLRPVRALMCDWLESEWKLHTACTTSLCIGSSSSTSAPLTVRTSSKSNSCGVLSGTSSNPSSSTVRSDGSCPCSIVHSRASNAARKSVPAPRRSMALTLRSRRSKRRRGSSVGLGWGLAGLALSRPLRSWRCASSSSAQNSSHFCMLSP